jgi:hypothetical protein
LPIAGLGDPAEKGCIMSSEFETLRKFAAKFESTAEDKQRARERSERVKRELGLRDLSKATPRELANVIVTCWRIQSYADLRAEALERDIKEGESGGPEILDCIKASGAADDHAKIAAKRLWVIARRLGLATPTLESLIGTRGPYLTDEGWDCLITEARRVAELAEAAAEAQGDPPAAPDAAQPVVELVDEEAQQAQGDAPAAPAVATEGRKAGGRLPKDVSEAKRATMMAIVRQHPTLADDPAKLAEMVGVGESTVRRWLDDMQQQYQNCKAARVGPED